MSDALFVDVSNLNVMYKVNGKFCLSVNYASCPEKLAMDAQALGSSFDVFLSMWPRPAGEGDITINGLSFGGVPFVALKEEVKAVFALVEKIPGVNTVYLCNALANFIIPSRVNNFKAVLCAGNRYAFVEVKDKMLSSMKMFDSQFDFYEEMGDDFTCHGDSDLIDVDTIKAQYPEFTEFKRNVIIPLTSMIMSYRSAYKMAMEDVKAEITNPAAKADSPIKPKPKGSSTTTAKSNSAFNQKPERSRKDTDFSADFQCDSEEYGATHPSYALAVIPPTVVEQRRRPDVLSILLSAVTCLAVFVTGFGLYFNNGNKVEMQLQSFSIMEKYYVEDTEYYKTVASIYDNGPDLAGKIMQLLSLAKSCTDGVVVSFIDVSTTKILLHYTCSTVEQSDRFTAAIADKYIILSKNEVSVMANPDGTSTREYSLEVVLG